MSGTLAPAYPVWVTTTSSTSDAPLQRVARRLDARDLDVARQPLLAHADGKHRHRLRLEPGDRLVDRAVRVVRAVGHQHQAGDRQAAQFVARAIERLAQPRARALELQVGRSTAAARPTTRTGRCAALKRLPSAVSSGASARPNCSTMNVAARLAVLIGHLHAARVVEQDADEVLLRHRDLEEQHRPEEAEEHDARTAARARPAGRAIASLQRCHLPVGPERRTALPRRRQPPSATSIEWLQARTGPARNTSRSVLEQEGKDDSNTEARLYPGSPADLTMLCHRKVLLPRSRAPASASAVEPTLRQFRPAAAAPAERRGRLLHPGARVEVDIRRPSRRPPEPACRPRSIRRRNPARSRWRTRASSTRRRPSPAVPLRRRDRVRWSRPRLATLRALNPASSSCSRRAARAASFKLRLQPVDRAAIPLGQ